MKNNQSDQTGVSRRQFIKSTAALTSAAVLSQWSLPESHAATAPAVVRTAVDQVTLGSTGIKLSRLGFGTGSNNGADQTRIGKEAFNTLIRYAYDQGITYFDTSQTYQTFNWIADAIKDLPREKIFIQSKIPGQPANILDTIDNHRKVFKTDYVDSLLIHCMIQDKWTDNWKRIMDAFDEAKEKKWIRAKGVSCHSLPALRSATATDWTEVHLVRVNPQGIRMDMEAQESWNNRNPIADIAPVMSELKNMKAKGHGVIGMKINGNGQFRTAEDREKSVRFAMSCKELDAVVIGFSKKEHIDEAIERINRALKEV